MMRTDPSKQCNNGDIKSWLGMGNCHWLCLSAFIWWKVCVSVWWVRAYYHRDMAVQPIAGPLSCVFCKTLVRYTSSCHSGGHDLSRSQRVIVWWCIYRHQASGSGDVLIWLIGGDVRAQPPITQAAAIKIVTVITPSQSENGQISLTQSHHGKVPHPSHHTSPAHLCSPGPPPTLKAKRLKAWHFMVLDYILQDSYIHAEDTLSWEKGPAMTRTILVVVIYETDDVYRICHGTNCWSSYWP